MPTGAAAPQPRTSLRRSAQTICEGARLSAFHRGSCLGDSRRQRLSARPGFLGRGESARSGTLAPTGGRRPCAVKTGVTRPRLSQSSDSTSRAGRSAGRVMPDAARERVAKPPAGTALAPRSGNACRAASERWARFDSLNVTEMETKIKRSCPYYRDEKFSLRHYEIHRAVTLATSRPAP